MNVDAGQSPVDFSINRCFLHSNAARPRLRVGILVDGDVVTAVERQIILDIQASDFADVVCVVQREAPDRSSIARSGSLLSRLGLLRRRSTWRHLAYGAYLRWYDSRRRIFPDPLAPAGIADLLSGVSRVLVTPQATRHTDRLDLNDVNRIRAYKLDVLLRFGFRVLRGDVLSAARWGVWSYHHGDSERFRGGPALLWELIERESVSGVVLQSLTEELDGGPVLAKALFATSPSMSVSENRFVPYWSTEHFVIRALHHLHERGELSVGFSGACPPYRGRRAVYRMPTNLEMGRWVLIEGASRMARNAVRRVKPEPIKSRWTIALRRTSTPLHEASDREALADFRWIPVQRTGFWADPFLIEHRGETWMFFEEYVDSLRKGVISCVRVDPAGDGAQTLRVLERPYHLSYPHVLAHEGEVFMIPESAQSGTVDLYRAVRFPDQWVFERTLLKLCAVDSTVFVADGQWWLFSSPRIVSGASALTYLWTADSLFGPWRIASHQPVSSDVRSARGAGAVFRHGQQLWRPSQDCSGRYGRALVFNRIDRLGDSPQETIVKVIEPTWLPNMSRIHTYSTGGGWEAIDGLFDGGHPPTRFTKGADAEESRVIGRRAPTAT